MAKDSSLQNKRSSWELLMTESQKSHSITVTISYGSKISPKANPDFREGDNARAWTLGSLVSWQKWRGGAVFGNCYHNPLPPSKLLLIDHQPELCHRSIPKPTTGKDDDISRINHHIEGCITVRGQHHCMMTSHQGRLTLAFPILLWIHCGSFLWWSLPPLPSPTTSLSPLRTD